MHVKVEEMKCWKELMDFQMLFFKREDDAEVACLMAWGSKMCVK